MTLSNNQIINAMEVVSHLYEDKETMPIVIAFALMQNVKKIQACAEIYDEAYKLLIDRYSLKNDKGEVVVDDSNCIKFKDFNSFKNELTTLLSQKSEIDINPLNINKCDNLKLSLDDMLKIGFLFSE